MAKGNVKNVSIRMCADPAYIDPVGSWGLWFWKWRKMSSPEPVSPRKARAQQANSEVGVHCGSHKDHFCFLEHQEVFLKYMWTTPKWSPGSLDCIHLVSWGEFWW